MKNYPKYTPKTSKKTSGEIERFFAHNSQCGAYGENYVADLLAYYGYSVQNTAKSAFQADLRVLDTQTGEVLKIEVKTAVCNAKGVYKFCLWREKHTDCSHSDFVILVCLDNYGCHYIFVIPTTILNIKNLEITSHPLKYKGKYSQFLTRQKVTFDGEQKGLETW